MTGKPGTSSSKTHSFIGQVVEKKGNQFVGNFVRPKVTSDYSGYIYTYPPVHDISDFSYSQVIGNIDNPHILRRGQFKFNLNSQTLSS